MIQVITINAIIDGKENFERKIHLYDCVNAMLFIVFGLSGFLYSC